MKFWRTATGAVALQFDDPRIADALYARNGGACARTLPINSTNDVLPGGPVSSVAGKKGILGGAKIISPSIGKSTVARSTVAGVRFFWEIGATARRILQHSIPAGCG